MPRPTRATRRSASDDSAPDSPTADPTPTVAPGPPGPPPTAGRRRVWLAPNDLLQAERGPTLIQWPHPRTGQPAAYLIQADDTEVRELVAVTADHRAWFIDEGVESDGRLHLVAPFDPTFVLIAQLAAAPRLMPLEHLLLDPRFPALSRLHGPHFQRQLPRIARPQGSPDLNVWQYDRALTLAYLAAKVERLVARLERHGVDVAGAAQSAHFVRTSAHRVDPVMYRRYAWATVALYLSDELGNQLRVHLDLPAASVTKRAPASAQTSPEKKPRSGKSAGPLEDYSVGYTPLVAKVAPQTARQKALAKSATGSKTISSFFRKK